MDLAALGAFLSGAGAVLGAAGVLYLERRRAAAECERRLQAFREGLKWNRGG